MIMSSILPGWKTAIPLNVLTVKSRIKPPKLLIIIAVNTRKQDSKPEKQVQYTK